MKDLRAVSLVKCRGCAYRMALCALAAAIIFASLPKDSYSQQIEGSGLPCNCVIFRFDDIQDDFVQPAQLAVMDLFLLKNQSLSLGLIMGRLGDNDMIVDKILEGSSRGIFELSNHSWTHENHSTLTKAEQLNSIQQANDKMAEMFGDRSDVFIAPYNRFNSETLDVMKEVGMKIISSETDLDKYPYFLSSGDTSQDPSEDEEEKVHHIPATTAFRTKEDAEPGSIKEFTKVPVEQIMREIDSSIASYGYAVVMMHPQDFVRIEEGRYTKIPDERELVDLARLMDLVQAKGYQISTFSHLAGLSDRHYEGSSRFGMTYGRDTPLNVFTLGNSPAGVAINSATGMIFVTNSKSDTVSVIDGSTRTVLQQIRVGGAPFGIAVNQNTNTVYVANWLSDSVSIIDGSTLRVVGNLPVGGAPFGIAVNQNTNTVYVANWLSDSVSIVDGSTHKVIDSIRIGGKALALAVNPATNFLYAVFPKSLAVVNLEGKSLSASIEFDDKADRVAVSPATNTVYVTHAGSDSVSVIDGSTNSVIKKIAVGDVPVGIAVDPVAGHVFVANSEENTISVIDDKSHAVVLTLQVGENPVSIDVNTATAAAYVANINSHSVSILDSRIVTVPEFPTFVVMLAVGFTILFFMQFTRKLKH
ncbi:polysaccharide deacetylase family protein [Nitrososphaera sp.]|uniref:YVTN family beta-propeller repeat protein n=1 Tax=Nitrososphaera sp. TaxID=1971748 RepID=UPI0018202EF7|nr:polysaccharide deacetylase family protein [Nitrososphaera sp.]NWG37570.1 polysaccharide deacetylase family protein [Nitrososphaera sp.]